MQATQELQKGDFVKVIDRKLPTGNIYLEGTWTVRGITTRGNVRIIRESTGAIKLMHAPSFLEKI